MKTVQENENEPSVSNPKLATNQHRMKGVRSLSATGAFLAALLATASASAGTHYLWSGGAGDMLWSSNGNWSPVGLPGVSDNVTFTNAADAGFPLAQGGSINNIVDANFLTSINSLGYQVTNAYHNTQLVNSLHVIGTSATDVAVIDDEGQPYVFFVGDNQWQDDKDAQAWASFIGGSLLVSNVNANFGVTQISSANGAHRATLDLTNVNTFTCVVSNFLVGHNFTQPDHAWRPTGEVWLAQTNSITTKIIDVADAYQNAGAISYIHLGQVNTINSDEIRLAMHKTTGTIDIIPGLVNPTVTFRNAAGTGRQVQWEIADEYDANSTNYLFGFFTSNQAVGVVDLTGAKVDASVDQIVLGRGQVQWDATNRQGDGNGTLVFGGGIIDVNSIQMGIQVTGPFIGGSIGRGHLTVNNDAGAGPALLNVHNNIIMAVQQPGSSDNGTGSPNGIIGSQADITVNNGSTVAVAGDIIAGDGTSTINLNNGGTLDMKPAGDTTAGNVTINILNVTDGIITNYNVLSVTNISEIGVNQTFTVYAGQSLAPAGSGKIATLGVSGSLTARGTLLMDIGKSGGVPLFDQVAASGIVDLGGTLKVSYAGAHEDLAAGDKFFLFSVAPTLSSPTVVLPPPGSGLKWQNNISVDGSIQVVVCGCGEPTTAPTLTINHSAPTSATISWPLSYVQFSLRAETNGFNGNWGFVPGVVGNSVTLPIDPANNNVSFQLIQTSF